MFNLFRSREKVSRYLMAAVLPILAASMLTYLTQTGLTSADNETVIGMLRLGLVTIPRRDTQPSILSWGTKNLWRCSFPKEAAIRP